MLTIKAGDTEFLKTCTQMELDYIYAGCNWISKLARECKLKALHKVGYTLDELDNMTEPEQEAIWDRARNSE